MFGILIFVAFYSFIAGAYYAITKDEYEALLWVVSIPFKIGKLFIKLSGIENDGKEKGTDTKGKKE